MVQPTAILYIFRTFALMKNPFKYLIPAYYSALSGSIVLGSSIIQVYDGMAAPNADQSNIMIGERSSSQLNAKCSFTSECFVLIDIVIKGANYSFQTADDVAEQVLQRVNSNLNPTPSSSFQVVTTSVQSINNLSSLNSTDQAFRMLIRFRNVVTQIA